MALKIKLNSQGDSRFRITLGDNQLIIRTYFNKILNYWIIDLSLDDGTAIATGLNLVAGINLLEWSDKLTDIYGQFRMTDDAEGSDSIDTAELIWFAPGEFEKLFEDVETFSPPLNYDFDALFPVIKVV